jgi:hypothetical protein
LTLYEWHGELAAACFGTMHHFEVLMRNAIDDELGNGHPETPLTHTWLLDFDVIRPDGIKQVIVAAERLEKGKTITRGRSSRASRLVSGLASLARGTRSFGGIVSVTRSRSPRSERLSSRAWRRCVASATGSPITIPSSSSPWLPATTTC